MAVPAVFCSRVQLHSVYSVYCGNTVSAVKGTLRFWFSACFCPPARPDSDGWTWRRSESSACRHLPRTLTHTPRSIYSCGLCEYFNGFLFRPGSSWCTSKMCLKRSDLRSCEVGMRPRGALARGRSSRGETGAKVNDGPAKADEPFDFSTCLCVAQHSPDLCALLVARPR